MIQSGRGHFFTASHPSSISSSSMESPFLRVKDPASSSFLGDLGRQFLQGRKGRKEGKTWLRDRKGSKRERGERESKGTPVALKTCIQGRGNRLTGGLPKELFYVASKCFASTFAAHSRRRGDPAPLKERGGKRERNCKPRKFFRVFFPRKKGAKLTFLPLFSGKKVNTERFFLEPFILSPVRWSGKEAKGSGGEPKSSLSPPLFYTGSPSVRPS